MYFRIKGFAFILNNKTFPEHPDVKSRTRKGSEVDLANMTHLWEEIGYRVFKYDDLTGQVRDLKLHKSYFVTFKHHSWKRYK